jgi:hypothetical protein
MNSSALQEIRESIRRWGYAHTEPGALAEAAGWVVIRGLCVDTVHKNTPEGRAAVRGDEGMEQLRRLPRVRVK